MCGRYVSPKAADIERQWNLRQAPNPFDRVNYNVAPTQRVPALRRAADGAPQLAALRWGLIPFWAKGVALTVSTINATVERIREAPSYRGPWRRGQRCIVAASGFYEWQVVQGAGGKPAKQPWYIRIGDQEIFGMAGLWDASTAVDGSVVESCTLITLPANRAMAVIHNTRQRMPAILTLAQHPAWLDGTPDEGFSCLTRYPDELMIAHRVSARVNTPKNNDADLLQEVPRQDAD